ncbi:bifunctional glycosyltransferase family 2/GtrA family protein [Arthrobacter sp. NEB 688]|uniref:bifunctional glycosyltransferase family 2/GtrA family protein n=1 Tax=Arthrobacter sp. NEB 688 TaxID=904039 RepID=UPI002570EECE|nr:bifunctional glycosyltransferase family 2/GtrA family protein [Arthrobacter sp. NEB 688]
MIVLVPAYEPDGRLGALVADLLAAQPDLHVLVVDDGSGPASAGAFADAASAGAVVVHHEVNRGKGRALKTGFREAARRWPGEDVVCADSDGQHTPGDVLAVAARVAGSRRAMVLGVRRFSGPVPGRSRLGNAVTRRLFVLTTGIDLSDTQTGLRAYPCEMLGWLCRVEGERFEYELELLLRAHGAGHAVVEVPIATVYLEGNASSHFRPVRDSLRVYAPMARFAASSLLAAAVDYALLVLLHVLSGSLLLSVVGARVVSASVNYRTNRRFVFGRGGRHAGLRYAALVAVVLAANAALMQVLVGRLGLALLVGKVLTEAVLLTVSFVVQRRCVFAVAGPAPGVAEAARAPALRERV